LVDGQYRIGRDPGCEIALTDTTVSREHALLTVAGSSLQIADFGSRHGVIINGASIQSGPVLPTDTVQLGRTVFTAEPAYEDPAGMAAYGGDPNAAGYPDPYYDPPRQSSFGRNLALISVVVFVILMCACCFGVSVLKKRLIPMGADQLGRAGIKAVSKEDIQKLQVGMSRDQVEQILGKPSIAPIPEGVNSENAPEEWNYPNVIVQFRDGKLVAVENVAAPAADG